MGGQVEGNIIATSYNGRTRVRLRGRDGDRDITAGLIFEQKEDAEKLQKEHGSDDNDAERAKIYANLAKNPQLLVPPAEYA